MYDEETQSPNPEDKYKNKARIGVFFHQRRGKIANCVSKRIQCSRFYKAQQLLHTVLIERCE